MPFTINNTNRYPIVIPDVTTQDAGVMTPALLQIVNSITSSRPPIPLTRKVAVNNTPLSLFVVDMTKISDNSFASQVQFGVESTDGSDVQIRSGQVNANLALKSGAYTTSQAVSATNAITAGTLTTTFSWSTAGSLATLQITIASSLTPTDLHIDIYMPFATHPTAVSLA